MNTEPQKPTHTLRTDAVNKDASVKRIELDFCKTDQWTNCWPGMLNIAEMFEEGVNKMVNADENSVGSQMTIMNAETCKPIEDIRFYPHIVKPEYIAPKPENKETIF